MSSLKLVSKSWSVARSILRPYPSSRWTGMHKNATRRGRSGENQDRRTRLASPRLGRGLSVRRASTARSTYQSLRVPRGVWTRPRGSIGPGRVGRSLASSGLARLSGVLSPGIRPRRFTLRDARRPPKPWCRVGGGGSMPSTDDRTLTCPVCGTSTVQVTILGPGTAVLTPCGHVIPPDRI